MYSNEAKIAQAGVKAETIEQHGAVSAEVAEALAEGARAKLGADVGVGITGIAGPGGGTEEKPVGLVWLSVATADGEPLTRSVNLPGSRADIRDRTTTVAMHLIRRALLLLSIRSRRKRGYVLSPRCVVPSEATSSVRSISIFESGGDKKASP